MKILIMFARNFFTERMVVMSKRFPIRPKKMNINAKSAPTKVVCRVGNRNDSFAANVEKLLMTVVLDTIDTIAVAIFVA